MDKDRNNKPQSPRTITLPPRDYQPTKAEKSAEIDMPGADLDTVRKAFFRPIKVKEKAS